jgi:vacuolar protein sorting-associated protein 13D
LQALDIRLSYNDVQLFLAIAKSIPEQANAAVPDSAALEADCVLSYPPGASRVGEEIREGRRHALDPVLGRCLPIKFLSLPNKAPSF